MTSLLRIPAPDKAKHPRQKSVDINDLFLTRFMPPWSRPASLPANTWRAWVLNQPVAIDCRETLIASTLALDWKITPIDSNYQQELDGTIKHYTKLFKNGGNYPGLGLDYSGLIEWIAADILDTPFGGAAEIGHKGGEAGGRVQWIRPLDAGTLFPTLNQEFPVIQYWQGWDAVVFKAHEIARVFMSPHTYIWREGWGMAPPEKVYFAMDMLGRGDKYYANLLLDIPTAGILDLGDMEKSSAEEWITAFKTFVNDNTTSFRVPVLYEHNNKVEFIPFGKVPNDIMFDKISLKYAALVCAAYGMSLSDIGLQTTSSSGETLAGSIRQERRTKRTGFARLKIKLKAFFDYILPKTIEFNFIDYDDELNVALGKARLASATALSMMQDKGQITAQEARSQYIQDGLMSISMPDEIPPDAIPLVETQNEFEMTKVKETNKEPELLGGDKKPPSGGGEGEVRRSKVTYKFNFKELSQVIQEMCVRMAPKVFEIMSVYGEDEILVARSMINNDIFGGESLGVFDTVSDFIQDKSLIKFSLTDLEASLKEIFGTKYTSTLKSRIHSDVNSFLVRSIAHHLNEVLFTIDLDDEIDFRSIVYRTHDKVFHSLNDYLSAYINAELMETQEQVAGIIQEAGTPDVGNEDVLNALSKLSGEIQNLALVSKTPVQKFEPIINLPEITVNNSFPKQADITVEAPIVNNSFPISVPAPIVNVTTPEFPEQDIIVNVPKQDMPVVNVSVPEQVAPVVNVNNQVSPTPVEITNPVTVNVPKVTRTRTRQDINRDARGFLDTTDAETEFEYDDK
jgi:hypothetical protein